jgi:signal transduction histidine kinase
MSTRARRASRAAPMSWLGWMRRVHATAPRPGGVPRDALVDAALALGVAGSAGSVDEVLRAIVDAAARSARSGAALLVVADGRVARLAARDVDGCTRDTLSRPDVLGALVERARLTDRPFSADELGPPVAGTLAAVAPAGVFVMPVEEDALLVLVDAAPDASAELAAVAVLARDTLARARRIAALEDENAELRALLARVLVGHDEQLGWTAHELHDGVCQRLAAAGAQLEALAAVVDGQRGALGRVRDARALVNRAVGELRELAQRLRPSVLEHLGYVEAVRWYLGRLRERGGVVPSLEVEGAETRLPVAVETALYRATEEALRAAADAATSPRVRVRYRRERENVRIEIAGASPAGASLVAMRERLRPFGGDVELATPPDRPPLIRVQVPAPVD